MVVRYYRERTARDAYLGNPSCKTPPGYEGPRLVILDDEELKAIRKDKSGNAPKVIRLVWP